MKNRIPEMKKYFGDGHLSAFNDLKIANYWIAGGAVRDFFLKKKPKDIDFYFENPKDRDTVCKFLISEKNFKFIEGWRKHGYHGVRGHDCLELDGLKYELFYTQPTPKECINEFDYTVCACALDKNLNFYRHKLFFDSLSRMSLKRIDPTLIEYRSSSIRELTRLLRFLDDGYTIETEDLKLWLEKTIKIDNFNSKKWVRLNSYYEQD